MDERTHIEAAAVGDEPQWTPAADSAVPLRDERQRDGRASPGRRERGAGGWKCVVEGQPSADDVSAGSAATGAARPAR